MCGRYVSTHSADEIAEVFGVERSAVEEPLQARWNVAPTTQVPAVLDRAREDGSERQLRTLRWGLVPSWAKDRSRGTPMINARLETAHEKPSFRRAFARRRCLLPADGFYEWYGEKKGAKQPFYLHPRSGLMAMAGLYEIWRDPDVAADDDPQAWLWSVTILTTSATDEVGRVHDRMPLLLTSETWDTWLDPHQTDVGEVRGLLHVAQPGELDAYPVSTEVNNVRNDGPHLVDSVSL